MRQKLGEMRRMMKKAKTDQADPRAAYERMQRRLDMAVNSGKMTQEEADQKLQEFAVNFA